MKTMTVTYEAGGVTCKGYLAYQDTPEKKPCVLVVHAFEGCNDLARDYANKCAELGYVGFAVDMYGDGVVEDTLEGCMEHAMALFTNRELVRTRMQDTYAFAKTLEQVDPKTIAAMGFCLGGLCCLDLARSGTNVKGVASFHGALVPPVGLEKHPITAQMLVMTGYDDPQVPPEQVQAFCEEMKNDDLQLIVYTKTKHAFTDPDAAKIGPPEFGREYHAQTTARAWQACQQFFADILT
jgi:dienelactone hydrolase